MTFDANTENNGAGEDQVIKTNIEGKLVSQPEDLADTDTYTFAGWFAAATGGDPITDFTGTFDADTTYYAQWTAK